MATTFARTSNRTETSLRGGVSLLALAGWGLVAMPVAMAGSPSPAEDAGWLGAAYAAVAQAQATAPEAEQAAHAAEEEVVVVGVLTTKALNREEIELTQANDLADLFRAVPSVSVGGGVGLAQKIFVRGLEESQLNVTIDGAPQKGTLFHHIGRVNVEPEILESVEVQTGPGEATAGFGAIGGAIRFRTRNPVDLLRDGQNVGGILRASWFSNDGYKLSGTAYGRLDGDIGILGSYVRVERDPYEDGDGVTQRATGATQELGFLKVGGDIGAGHWFSASYEHRKESGRFGVRPNWPVFVGDTLYPAEGKRQTAVLNYGYDGSGLMSVELTGYWTRSTFELDRFDRWGLYGADVETFGFDARGGIALEQHDIVFGVEYRNDSVSSEYLAPAAQWQPWAWDPAIGRFEEEGELIGIYVQDHWSVTDRLLVSYGVRYDSYDFKQVTYGPEADDSGFSFNAGLEYEVIDGLKLSAGYAQAFRGKEIGDAFTLEHRPGRLTLSPTLQPETVENFEIGIAYDRDGFTASAVYFDMTIDDVLVDQLYNGGFPQDAIYYENIGTFKSRGYELRAGYTTGPFSIDAYFNHYDSRLNGHRIEGYEHLALGNSLGDSWNLTAGYQPDERFNFRASLTRVESLDDIEVLFRDVELGYIPSTVFVDKPGYTVVDLFASWRPFGNDGFELQAAIYNLFDEQYVSHASVADYTAIPDYEIVAGLPEPGRNIRLSSSFRF